MLIFSKILEFAVSAFCRSRAYSLFWKSLFSVLVLDQFSKCLIALTLDFPTFGDGYGHDPLVVIPGFFNIVHVRNYGAAWSMFSGQRFLLSLFAIGCLGMFFYFRRTLEIKKKEVQLPMGLLCGGIIGNLVDRIFHGFVIDFLDFKLPLIDMHWPSFNVADCGICLGVFYFLLINLISYYKDLRNRFMGNREEGDYPDIDELSKKQ
ncbi:MAG: signal peptidase II [Opitutales bacterium]|nr:signal peptidase II [Opitutales bacterium]